MERSPEEPGETNTINQSIAREEFNQSIPLKDKKPKPGRKRYIHCEKFLHTY